MSVKVVGFETRLSFHVAYMPGTKYWYQAVGTKNLVSKYLVPSNGYQSTWYQGSWYRSTWYQMLAAKYLLPSTWSHVLGTKVHGTKYLVLGSW